MDFKQFTNRLIETAKSDGFLECEVFIQKGDNMKIMVYEGEVNHFENSIKGGVCFRGIVNGKMGYSYSEKIDFDVIPYLLKEAKENAEIIELTEDEEIYCGDACYPTVCCYNEDFTSLTVEDKIKLAINMEKEAKLYDKRITGLSYCMAADGMGEVMICNSKGLFVSFRSNYGMLYSAAIAKEGEDIKTGSHFVISNKKEDFLNNNVGERSGKKALSHLGAKTIPSGSYKVILQNEAAGDLLSCYVPVFYGENVQKGFSLLKDKEDTLIASSILTICDNALNDHMQGSSPFDSEGVSCKNKNVVECGILKTLLYNLKSAKTAGVKSTGNGFKASYSSPVKTSATNFYIKKGTIDFRSLVLNMGDGIIITELSGLHTINIISGDFSLSAEGFLVKGGRVVSAVEQITVSGNFYKMLSDVVDISDDLLFGFPSSDGNIGSPSLLIKELSVSGS